MSAVAKIDEAAAVPALAEQSPVMAMISAAAKDPDFDAGKLEKLVGMAEREQAKKAEMAFNASMGEAQQSIRRVAADKENSHTKSSYASYAALDRAIRPVYTQHGFALSFDTGDNPPADHVRVICHVMHRAGHTRDYKADIPCDGKGAQGKDVMTKTHAVGSAMSYGSRYLLKLIFNVAVGEDDDDGNLSGGLDKITKEEVAELEDLLKRGRGDLVLFLQFMDVGEIADIPRKQISKARRALNENLLAYEASQRKAAKV
jgi:hypothetical protein